jgi:type II secretory pathway pseudopilin PulG
MRRPRSGELGFTLVEVLVAAGIFVAIAGALLAVMQTLFAGAHHVRNTRDSYVALARLLETWDAEAATALAIFVPPRDVLGGDNADGHEVDFYSRDAHHYGRFWAYRWDRATQTLWRYTYPSPGVAAVASDPPLEGIAAFRATQRPASALVPPFLGGYVAKDVVVNFGYPGVNGGNAVTTLTVANARNGLSIELLPGTLASGFSVVVGTFTAAPVPTPSGAPAGPLATDTPVAATDSPAPVPTDVAVATPTAAPAATAPSTTSSTATPQPTDSPSAAPARTLVGYFDEVCNALDGTCGGDPEGDCVAMGGNEAVYVSQRIVSPSFVNNRYACWLNP